jgi:hypothetical protein
MLSGPVQALPGRLRLLAAIVTCAGLALTSSSASAASDTTPPTVHLDGGMFIPVGQTLTTSNPNTARINMNMTWSASDDIRITSEDVWLSFFSRLDADEENEEQHSARLYGSARQWTIGVLANAFAEAGCSGGIWASDAAGNSDGQCLQYSWGYIDGRKAFTLHGKWTAPRCHCWMNGNTLKSTQVGASATFTMGGNDYCDLGGTPGNIGSSAGVIGDFASKRGTAKVYVDGKQVSTIHEKGATKNRVVVFQKRYKGFTTATHTVKIVVKSGRFDLDGLIRQSSWYTDGCGG